MRFNISILIVLLVSLDLFARELKVESFESLGQKDLTAQISPKEDLNGNKCAVIKVSAPEGMKFEGNVISSIYDVNEYIIYVSPGTKSITIKLPGYETYYFSIPQSKYPSGLEGGRTYRLKFIDLEDKMDIMRKDNLSSKSIGANYVVFNITPQNGISFRIDDQIHTVEDGEAMSFLKLGQHSYIVEAEGYSPKIGSIIVNEGDTQIIDITLESVMATLTIDSKTKESTIYVNGQIKGYDIWSGQMPAGLYNIEVMKNGYTSYRETIELNEQDNKKITIPSLEPIYGTLQVEYKPIGSTILIDGKEIGQTPKLISDIIIGEHTISIRKDGYGEYSSTINLQSQEPQKLTGSLNSLSTNNRSISNDNEYESTHTPHFKITGNIRNSKNNEPINHEPIMCILSRKGKPLDVLFTNNNGYYSFNMVQIGDKLEVYYDNVLKKEIIISDNESIKDIYIEL